MRKKTNKNTLATDAKNLVEIYPLTPIKIDNSNSYYCVYEEYKNRLAKVFKNNELTNIAISGYFGIGKSSVLKTFSKEESKNFLHISLIDFSNNTDMHEQDNKFEKANELEAALCRQIISACRKKEFPKLRFQTVPEEISCPKLWGLIIFITMYSFVLLSSLFSNYISDFSHKLGFNFGGYGSLILYILCIILSVVLVFLCAFYILKHMKIKEFGLKASKNNLEASASWTAGNESVLEKYRFDLIYVLEKLSQFYDAIIFEDMDRIDTKICIKIFSQLREINICTNNRINQCKKKKKKSNSSLRFIYVINDDLTGKLNQTKFFDYIISIIPSLSVSNAKEKFEALIFDELKINLMPAERDTILSAIEVCPDLLDYRTLNQIKNDYGLFLSIIKESETNVSNKEGALLAFVIYKVLCPGDYHLIASQKSAFFPTPRNVTVDDWLARGCSIQNHAAVKILAENEPILLTPFCLKFIGYSKKEQKQAYKYDMINSSRKRKLQIIKDDEDFICGEIIIEETDKENIKKMILEIQNELLIYFLSNFSRVNNSFGLFLESLMIDEGVFENEFHAAIVKELHNCNKPNAYAMCVCFFIKRGYKEFDWFFSNDKQSMKSRVIALDKLYDYDFSIVFEKCAPAELELYESFLPDETKLKESIRIILRNKTD